MRRVAVVFLAAAVLCVSPTVAAPKGTSAAALLACWGKGETPTACAAQARTVASLPRTERTALLGELVKNEAPASKSLALWLAIETHTPFDDTAAVEAVLALDDARLLAFALDYVAALKVPVHASLIHQLATKSSIPNVRAAAIRLLPDLDPTLALPAARDGLTATSGAVLAASAGALGKLKDAASIDALVRLVSDPRHPIMVRLEVVDALRRLGDPTVAALLFLQFRWAEPMVVHKLVTAFGEIAPPALATFLTDELTGDYSREAMVALARLKNPETVPALVGLFDRTDIRSQTQHLLFWALGEMKDPGAVPALLVQLRASDTDRATRAAEALGTIGAKSAVRPLIDQLSNPDAGVTDMVVWALEKITGQTFEKDRTLWDAWLEQNPY